MKKYLVIVYEVIRDDSIMYSKEILLKNVFEIKGDKKDLKNYILNEYSELFPNGKLLEKTGKDLNQLTYFTIRELNSYWEKYWLEEDTYCKNKDCKNKFRRIDIIDNNLTISEFYCCAECEKKGSNYVLEGYYKDIIDKGYIYCIENKCTGKKYIGSSKRDVFFRWREHLLLSDTDIGIALRKEGIDNFTFTVIKELDKKDFIDFGTSILEIEDYFIQGYNTVKDSYTMMYNTTNK